MVEAVIFDMDGVLIDSQPNYFYADMKTIERCGISVDLKFTESYAGLCNEQRWAKYKEDLGIEEEVEKLIQINMEIYYDILNNGGLIPVEGSAQLVKLFFEEGYKLAVASSSPIDMIEKVVHGLHLKEYFSVLVSGEHMERSKPDPEIFIKTAEKLNIDREKCIIIEDSVHGVTASLRAGIKCIGFKNPNSGNQDLSNADITIDSFAEINKNLLWLDRFN